VNLLRLSFSACCLLLPAAPGLAVPVSPDPRLAAAITSIESTIAKSGADVAVAYQSLDGRSSWYLEADEPFHAASTMKVPVLIELYHQAREGKLRLDDTLVIRNEFRSLADGSPYVLDASDDSEADLYRAAGHTHETSRNGAAEIRRLLGADLDVPAALEAAIETGGAPARLLVATLGLD